MTTPTPDPAPAVATSTRSAAELLEHAVAAAHGAAEYLRALDRSQISRTDKTSNHDIVTVHDRACEDLIVEELRRRVPEARIIGEEGGVREAEAPSTGEDTIAFHVDPIDGTSNFAAGLPIFCVSIGVTIGAEIVAGVIDVPILDQVFTAADGTAYLNGEELVPRPTRAPRDALVLTGTPGPHDIAEDAELAARGHREMLAAHSAVRHLGSAAIELAYVAAGWADATMLTRINSWDITAGFLLVRCAGGSIRTWPGTGPSGAADHERPAYVACTGTDRLPQLDALQGQIQTARTAVL